MFTMQLMKRVIVAILALESSIATLPVLADEPVNAGDGAAPQNFDLSAADKSFNASRAGQFTSASIQVGSQLKTILPGDKVTAAELVAIQQVLGSSGQNIVLSDLGTAVSGTLQTSNLNFPLGGFSLPGNVTAVHDFTSANNFHILGDFTNAGLFVATATNAGITAQITANNITNLSTGTITSVIPANLQASFSNLARTVSLAFSASGEFRNQGIISSSGNLSVAAASIVNAPSGGGMQPVMQAAGVMNLFSASGFLRNEGLISAIQNINIDTIRPSDIMINNALGRLESASGAINIRNAAFAGSESVLMSGGDVIARELNVFSGTGVVNVSAETLTSELNFHAREAHVTANTENLYLGDICLSGDPTFYNTAGNVVINGNLIFSGAPLAIVARGNITTAAGAGVISTASATGKGGDITLIAGANFTSTGPASVLPPGAGDSTSTLTITGGTGIGGFIDLASTPITTLSSSSSFAGASGGNITLVAFGGAVVTSGIITVPGTTTITAGGAGTGSNGTVAIIAGNNNGGVSISTGAISTTGGAGYTGAIGVATVNPNLATSLIIVDGAITSGSFTAGALRNASLSVGTLTVDGGVINLVNGAGVLTLPGITTRGGTLKVGSSALTVTGTIDTSGVNGGIGGAVSLSTMQVLNTQDIITRGSATGGASGNIDLTAGTGIITGNLQVTPLSATKGASITINCTGGAITTGSITHTGIDYGGAVTAKITGSTTVTTGAIDYSGALQITAAGNIQTGTISTHSQADRTVKLSSTGAGITTGNITVSSNATSDINDLTITAFSNVNTGALNTGGSGSIYWESGDISVTAGGSIATGNINTSPGSAQGTAGTITLMAGQSGLGSLSTGSITSGATGDTFTAGKVTLSASNKVTIAGNTATNGSSQATSSALVVTAVNGISITGGINASNLANRKSGVVSLITTNGDVAFTTIDTRNNASSMVDGFFPTAGDITVSTNAGNVSFTSIDASAQNNAFAGNVDITLSGGAITVSNTINTSASNNHAGRVYISGAAAGASSFNSAGISSDTAILTSSGGSKVEAGWVRISLGNSDLSVTGGINSSATNQARAGAITVSGKSLAISGAVSSSSTGTFGGDIDLSSQGNLQIQSVSSAGTRGGKILLAAGTTIDAALTATSLTSTGTTDNGGAVVLLASGDITIGALTSSSTSANGGNLSLTAGRSSTNGNITFGSINTSGVNGGHAVIGSLGAVGAVLNPASNIQTSSSAAGGTAGSVTISTAGNITLANIIATGAQAGAQGGSILLSAGGAGTAVQLNNVNTSAAGAAGNLYVLHSAGASVSIGTVSQSGAPAGFTNIRVPDTVLNDITVNTAISFSSGAINNFRAGGFLTANAPGADISIDTSGDPRLIVPVAVLNGDFRVGSVFSILNGGARSPVAIMTTGALAITGNIDGSASGKPGPALSFVSNFGPVTLQSVSANGDPGGTIVIASPQLFQLNNGGTLTARSAGGLTTGGNIQISVPNGPVNLGTPNNQSNNFIDVSGATGGSIDIVSNGSITNYEVDLRAAGTTGNGGNISLTSYNGSVDFFNAYNGVSNFNADVGVSSASSNGGTLTIFGAGGITVQRDAALCCGGVNTSTFSANGAALGGTVRMSSSDANINLSELGSVTGNATAGGGTGGSFNALARNGNITATNITFTGSNGGSIQTESFSFNLLPGRNFNANGTAGAGGAVSISTIGLRSTGFGTLKLGDVDNRTLNNISATGTTVGGSITLSSSGLLQDYEVQLLAGSSAGTGGTVNIRSFSAGIQFYYERVGASSYVPNIIVDSAVSNGGTITINSVGQIRTFADTANGAGALTAVMRAQGPVLGGTISITSSGFINLTGFNAITAEASTAPGTGGSVTMTGSQIFINSVRADQDGGSVLIVTSNGGIRTHQGAAGVVTADTVRFTASGNGPIDLQSDVSARTSVRMDVFGGATFGDIIRSAGTITAPTILLNSSSGSIGTAIAPVIVTGGSVTANAPFAGENVYLQGPAGAQAANIQGISGGTYRLVSPNSISVVQPLTAPIVVLQTTAANAPVLLGANITGTTSVSVSANGSGAVTWTGGIITSPLVSLASGSGNIGAPGARVATATPSLTATTAGGTIMINNTGAVTLQASAGSAVYDITGNQNITVGGAISTGNLSLVVTGANGAITANAALTATGTALLTARGTGTITGGANIVSAAALTLTTEAGDIGTQAIPLLVTSGALSINSGGSVFVRNTGALGITAASVLLDLELTSSDTITVNGAVSGRNLNLQTTANNGSIRLANNLTASTGAVLTTNGSGNIASDGGKITAPSITLVSASGNFGDAPGDRLLVSTPSLTATTASPGSIYIANDTPLLTLGAYSNIDNFYFSNNGTLILNGAITSPVISVSTTGANGAIMVNAPLTGTDITLAAHGAGFVSGAGTLTATTSLSLSSGSGNLGSSFTPLSVSTGTLAVNTTGDAFVHSATNVTLVASSTRDFTLTAGTVATSAAVSSTGALTLNTSALTNDGTISATTMLTVQNGGALNVSGTGALSSGGLVRASSTTGSVLVSQGTISGALDGTAGGGSYTATATGGNLTLASVQSVGGNVSLSATAGSAIVRSGATIQATGNVTIFGQTGISTGTGGGATVTMRAGVLAPGTSTAAVIEPGDITSPGTILLQNNAGNVSFTETISLTANGGDVSIISANDISVAGSNNFFSANGGYVMMNAGASILMPAATSGVILSTARYLPGMTTLTIDGQSVRDYTGGGVALYVNSLATNLSTLLDNARLNRLAAGTLTISGSVTNTNNTLAVPTQGGTTEITATGPGKVGIVNSSFVNPAGLVLIDPPGDQIDLNNLLFVNVAPGLIPPVPPPPVVVVVPGGGAAGGAAVLAVPVVNAPGAGVLAAAIAQNSVVSESKSSSSSRTVLATDTLDVPITTPVHNERSCTAPAELGLVAEEPGGALMLVTNSCQGVYLDGNHDTLALADQNATISTEVTGQVSLKSGKLIVLDSKKETSINTAYGAITIPAESAVRIDSSKAGIVRIASIGGGDARMTLSGKDGKAQSLIAMKGEEIVVSAAEATDEELIPTDGIDRVPLAGSIMRLGKVAARKNRFDVKDLLKKEPLLNCSSTCLPQAFRKRVAKLIPPSQAPLPQSSNLQPIAFAQSVKRGSSALSTQFTDTAMIIHRGNAKVVLDANTSTLVEGTVLFSCRKQTRLQVGAAMIVLQAGCVALTTVEDSQITVRVLADSGPGSAVVTYDRRAIKLCIGQQVSISPTKSTPVSDNVPQRRSYSVTLASARADFSEFSLPFVLQSDPVIQALRRDSAPHALRIHDRIMKSSVCLSVATMGHGAFAPRAK